MVPLTPLAQGRNSTDGPPGVSVLRFTTVDFTTWSKPVEVLFLPNGGPPAGGVSTKHPNDGVIWTCKSMDRNDTHYLMIACVG